MNKKSQVIGQSTQFQETVRSASLIAVTDVPVLLTGQIGSGKKHLAKTIHRQSKRKQQAFVVVNCANLSKEFAEQELFATNDFAINNMALSNSTTKPNHCYLAKARAGTLFLNNISSLSESMQIKLHHFIETGRVEGTGNALAKQYDVRIIVASNKNLLEEVNDGNFRSDLFYRLNVVPVELPALIERHGDMTLLIEHFFCELVRTHHQTAPNFTTAAIKQMLRYNWPGNIRELKNVCERLFILLSGKEIDVSNLPQEIQHYSSHSNNGHSISLPSTGIILDDLEVDLIQQALQNSGGNKSRAARLLGLSRDTFLYRLKKYAINF